MSPNHGIIQNKRSIAEWLVLRLSDTVRGVIAILMMKVLAGEFAHIVTKEDIKQASAGTGKTMT